jgi:hypothetical protein
MNCKYSGEVSQFTFLLFYRVCSPDSWIRCSERALVTHGIRNTLFLRQKVEFNKRRFLVPANAVDTCVSLETLSCSCCLLSLPLPLPYFTLFEQVHKMNSQFWGCVSGHPYISSLVLLGGFWRNVGFQVLTTMVIKSPVFWDIMPCIPLKLNRRFGGTYRLLQGQGISQPRAVLTAFFALVSCLAIY